ncbi:Uncharacterized protein PBTT_05079 [Plasmodiophora brassicae]
MPDANGDGSSGLAGALDRTGDRDQSSSAPCLNAWSAKSSGLTSAGSVPRLTRSAALKLAAVLTGDPFSTTPLPLLSLTFDVAVAVVVVLATPDVIWRYLRKIELMSSLANRSQGLTRSLMTTTTWLPDRRASSAAFFTSPTLRFRSVDMRRLLSSIRSIGIDRLPMVDDDDGHDDAVERNAL